MLVSGGLAAALGLSVVNSLGDPIRKRAGQQCGSGTLFAAARGAFAFPTAVLAMAWTGRGVPPVWASLAAPTPCFALSVFFNALLNALVSLLMNRALQLSDIGLAVPFLSFTPVFLLLLAPLLLGELPSAPGALGVLLVTAGGFVLAHTTRHAREPASVLPGPGGEGNGGGGAYGASSPGGEGAASSVLPPLLRRPPRPISLRGPLLMLGVAFVWAFTSMIDKVGVQCAPSPSAYGASVLLLHPLLCLALHAGVERHMPHAAKGSGASAGPPLHLAALGGLTAGAAYALHVHAVSFLPVTYVIAIKRAGCVYSVLLGRLLHRERAHFATRLAAAASMAVGVALIVVAG